MKPKAQTLQQKMGFSDPDLTTPKHDELMLWLDSWVDIHSYSLTEIDDTQIRVIDNEGNTWKEEVICVEEFDIKYGLDINKIPKPKFKLSAKIWEKPIVDRTYTIGFADMLVIARASWGSPAYYINKKEYERWEMDAYFYFEVKPTIPSLGEVIRQIRMYQTYTHPQDRYGQHVKWFIVSPDNRFESQIESQGIGFIHAI